MAASQEQKVDFLLKKIGYVASKTGIAEDSSLSGTKKAPFGEAIPSPLVVPATNIWSDSSFIPTTPPGSSTGYIDVYLAGTSGHRMTADSTISGNRTFIAYSTYNDSSTAILGDWIDTSFSADYIIKVYKGDPNSGGVQLSAAGSGSNDTWFFDYSSGVLNFNGTQVPSGVTSSNIYIVGYRYVGGKGAQFPAGVTTATSLSVSGISTFGDDVNLIGPTAGVTSAYWDSSANTLKFLDNVKATFGDGDDLQIYHDGSHSYIQDSGVGNLKVLTNSFILKNALDNEFLLKATQNSSIELLYDNSKKFETTSYGTHTTGIASATTLSTGAVGTGINIGVGSITGPAEIIIDPAGVGDNTGTVRIAGDLQVDGTTVTLDTVVTEVDRLEVSANNTTVGAAITQTGSGDILNLYDGSTEVFSVEDGGRIVATATNSVIPFLYANYSDLPSASTYHGAFAHVHATGRAYYAHAGNWMEIVNKEVNGVVGTGTETYNVGAATFAGDVSIADKIIHTGDTNTAIRFPAADTFTVETAGAERVRVDSAGRVGIGVTNPGYELEIGGSSNIQIALTANTTSGNSQVYFGDSADDDAGALIYRHASDSLAFNVNAFEVMRLNSSGNLGIGTDNPLNGLDILQGTGRTRVTSFGHIITQNHNNGTTNYWSFAPRGGGELDIAYGSPNGDGTVAGDKVTITTGGNVGIATATPRQTLDVDGGVHIQENLNVVGVSTFQSNVHLGDNDRLRFGDGNDLQIFHDGTDDIISSSGSTLKIIGSRIVINNAANSENQAIFEENGAVKLYYDAVKKFETTSTGIDVTGNTETDDLTVTGTAYLNGTVSVGSSTGTNGQVLSSTGVGVTWATLPSARTTTTITAPEDQTSFPFNYNVGFLDVFYNGVKLANTEFTASNGTHVVLGDVAYAGDIVELVSYNTVSTGGGGGGASNLNDLVDVTITGSPVIGETLIHNGTKFVNDLTTTTTTTATTQVSILSLDLSVYRSVEYQIQVTEGSKYHTTKILAIHNGTAASHNEFGTLNIGASTATFDVDISGSNLRLLATPASSNSTVFKVKFTAIKV